MKKITWLILAWLTLCGATLAKDWIVTDYASLWKATKQEAQTGDRILIAPGVIAGNIVAPLNLGVTIQSQDPNDPAVIDAWAGGKSHAVYWRGAIDTTLRNVIIRNSSDDAIHIGAALDGVTKSEGLLVENIRIENTAGGAGGNVDGLKIVNMKDCVFRNITVLGWGHGGGSGVDMQYSTGILIEDCLFDSLGSWDQRGIVIKNDVHDVIVRGCRIAGRVSALNFGQFSKHNLPVDDICFEGNVVVGPKHGVLFRGVDGTGGRLLARRNLIYCPTDVVISWWFSPSDGYPFADGGEVSDNVFITTNATKKWHIPDDARTKTTVFERNRWYNQDTPADSKPTLPCATDGTYGVDPQVSVDEPIAWQFPWGRWVVNATPNAKTYTPAAGMQLAKPDPGGTLNLDLANPCVGSWKVGAFTSPLTMPAMSQLVLLGEGVPPPDPPNDLEERVEALEQQAADHEQRLGAVEKLKMMVDAIFEALRSY